MVIAGAGLLMPPGIRVVAIGMVIRVMNVMSLRAGAVRLPRGVATPMGNAMEGKRQRGHQHDAGKQASYVMPQSVHQITFSRKGPTKPSLQEHNSIS